MKTSDKKWIRIRIYLVAVFFILGLSANLFRAYQLQVLEREKLNTLAQSGYKDVVKLPPKRGTIYDRDQTILADSVEVGSIYANPRVIENKASVAGHLALSLGVSSQEILKILQKDSPFVGVKRKVSPDKIEQIKTKGLKGIGFTTESRRYYPQKDIAGQVLGFSGADNQGLEGIEKYYDDILKGPEETLVEMHDAVGKAFYISQPEGDGQDMKSVTLTIDKDIQYKAQEALAAQIKATNAAGGQCLIMDPKTGEILAMAVSPSFNPNIFNEFTSSDWKNRTITDCYEPGSTFKTFLVSAAIEERVITPESTFYCEAGQYKVGKHIIHDTHKLGTLSATDIVVESSNIGAVKIGQKLGYQTFYDYLKKFGFGVKAGIELKGERDGSVRSPERSVEIDRANAYFGHGVAVTSLQLATAISAIANGGNLMRPYLVKEIKDQSGNVVKTTEPLVVRRVISEETARKVTRIMEGVVSEKGTAVKATIPGFRVAGKTGTAQKIEANGTYSHSKYIAVFVGFLPADNPKMTILVMLDEPHGITYGGLVAAPVFSEVGKWSLNNLRIQPGSDVKNPEIVKQDKVEVKEPEKESNEVEDEAPAAEDEETGGVEIARVPDFSGQTMREVLKNGKAMGLSVVLDGTGRAITQYPLAGAPLEGVTSVTVTFQPSV
jgi:cell division protein FtsI (penicillin-binding protein 3)